MRKTPLYTIVIASLFAMASVSGVALSGQDKDFRETYEAFAVAMGTSNPPVIPPGMNATLQINVTRWTTDEEREGLFTALVEKGAEGLADALRKQPEAGWTRVLSTRARSSFPREVLRYARQFDLGEGKRRLVLGLDRPISFWEARNMPRWRDYDVTLIVMDVDAEGKGVGQLAAGVKLQINDDNKLVIENFGSEPVRLNNVRRH